MAEARKLRITRILPWALALAVFVAGDTLAQPVGVGSPAWNALPPAKKQILAPLAPDWEKFDATRKQKWRGIAQRYPKMTPEEQQRVKQQMGTWAQLSPAERQSAREQYKSLKSLPPEKKQEVRQQWEQYQSLPPEKKRELATKPLPGAAPPRGTVPPSGLAHGNMDSRTNSNPTCRTAWRRTPSQAGARWA